MKDAEPRTTGNLPLDVFDPAPVGVAVFSGPDHRLIYMNYAYQEIVGERPLGAPAREIFGDISQEGYFSLLEQVRETGKTISLKELPFEYGDHPSPGRERYASASLSKITLANGEDGVLLMAVEVTAGVEAAKVIGSVAEERRRFLQRYQSLLQIETQATWVTGPTGEANELSLGWQRYTGQSWEEYRGHGWLNVVHPDDRKPTIDKWFDTVRRLARWEHVFRLRTPDGAYRHVRVRGVPIVENGELVEWVGAVTDIEQEWAEQRHRQLLDQAAAATADLADLNDVLTALSKVIVPAVSDGCGIYLLPEMEDESVTSPFIAERVANTVRDGLLTRPPLRTERFEPDSDIAKVIRTRQPIRSTFPPGAPPPGAPPTGTEEWFAAVGANSTALVPVVVDGSVAAVVVATVCGDREPLTAADVDLLARMLDHAHAHLSNAMRFQRTQRVALALQNYLLPDPPRVPGLEIAARYRASATAAEIGGDWYDSFVSPDGSTILTIGDVAGHDLAAAVTMSQLRNMLRGLAMDRREPPGDILRRLNIATELLDDEDTATCILARVEGQDEGARWVRYSVAGHPPPLLVTPEGEARYLEGAVNPMLGVAYDMPRTTAVASLPPGSTLLLYTDGLVEMPGEHLDAGLERLRLAAASMAREPLDVFCDLLLTRLPMAHKDDIAMIAVRLPGA
ncbi:SpoIIE family protein phosphatase [Nonomuraea aridisoli]|uniref:protein-serine/threonine phosphatase n=1 Tax=Nonomuraea aridisoli TaxID=2070368 RepID=A0A2W2D0K8_9ACTN|nr:SpoIIE family protein phosphatase [Nonomuraea aridisoli]PZG05542.1 serine/threonine protein phosphatase [Nonomuraea aridisoli]